MAVPLSQENLKKVTDMMNGKTVDYSRIDWKKCNPGLVRGLKTSVGVLGHGLIQLNVNGQTRATIDISGERGWQIHTSDSGSAIDFVRDIVTACGQVDAFIAAETARIEAEDNWVTIHWRDADWLQTVGGKVEFFSVLDDNWLSEPMGDKKSPSIRYRTDRRTLPAGYDPEKPRWVKIHKDDARRLSDAGACVQRKMSSSNDNWMDMTSTERATHYDHRLDVHTLPPGVPLHEEPKSVPRPCSKEFAINNPAFSEFRTRGCGREYWSEWSPMNVKWEGCNIQHFYDFRTTAKAEPKSRIVAEVAVSSVAPGITANGNVLLNAITRQLVNGLTQVVVFEVAPDCFDSAKGKNPRIALIVDEVE